MLTSSSNVIPFPFDELRDALAAVSYNPQRTMDCAAVAYVWLARLLSRADLPIPFSVDGGPDPLVCWTAAIHDIHTEGERRDTHPAIGSPTIGNDAPPAA